MEQNPLGALIGQFLPLFFMLWVMLLSFSTGDSTQYRANGGVNYEFSLQQAYNFPIEV